MRDQDIRLLLHNTELLKYKQDKNSRIVEEMNLPAVYARIDLAVINGHLHGFEIKSASDTLQRLPAQLEAYSKVFDYLYIITEGKYSQRILEIAPGWIGVFVCQTHKGLTQLKKLRPARRNKNTESFYLAKLLWREEIIAVLNDFNIKYSKKDRNWLLCELLANNIPITSLSKIVRSKLKERTDWKEPAIEVDVM